MDSFVPRRCCISPAILCEKNSMGIRSTFHIYVVLPIAAILPLILREYIVCAHETIISSTASPIITPVKGMSQSRLIPERSLSMKMPDITGLMIPNIYEIIVVSITKATAAPAPIRRFLANSTVLFLFPLGLKSGPGTGTTVTPVKDLSNSSGPTLTNPLAGSFMYAYLPLNPQSTTKWLKFQCMMHGNCPFSRMLWGVLR